MVATLLNLSARHLREVGRLAEISHKRPMDLISQIPWQLGVDRQAKPKIDESSWLYGTEYWHHSSAMERHELLWQETARDVSMFIWLEQSLPPLYLGYINQYGDQLAPEVLEYLMIFSKEEIVHTLAFRRYMKLADLKAFAPPEGIHQLFTHDLPKLSPVAGILCTLIVEYVAELAAMHATQHQGVDSLTRSLFERHHVDELRHIAFARWVTESYFATAAAADAQKLRVMAQTLYKRVLAQFTFNAEIATRLPLGIKTEAQIDDIRQSESNQQLNAKRFKELNDWLSKIGVLGE